MSATIRKTPPSLYAPVRESWVIFALPDRLESHAPGGVTVTTPRENWAASTEVSVYIQKDINQHLTAVERTTGPMWVRFRSTTSQQLHPAFDLALSIASALAVASSREYREYLMGTPHAIAAVQSPTNKLRLYGLTPYLYGLRLHVLE